MPRDNKGEQRLRGRQSCASASLRGTESDPGTSIGRGTGDGGRAAALLEDFLREQRDKYLQRNPTSQRCLDLVQSWEQQHGGDSPRVSFDHLAFRTFGAGKCGIPSISTFLEDFGYTRRDALTFPQKKLRAYWFAPPACATPGALPRVFVSELAVEELSTNAQGIILPYVEAAEPIARHAFALSNADPLPWPRPTSQDFLALARESEYAAWTLVNGYALNHTTISVHQLRGLGAPGESLDRAAPLERLNCQLEGEGVKLNQQGGVIKVSPDGLLLQSSTVADSAGFAFSDGVCLEVPLSYMEFALRLVLPEFAHIPSPEIREVHRRDGFEAGNADKIFESTSSTQARA